jgi:hypothetical protein
MTFLGQIAKGGLKLVTIILVVTFMLGGITVWALSSAVTAGIRLVSNINSPGASFNTNVSSSVNSDSAGMNPVIYNQRMEEAQMAAERARIAYGKNRIYAEAAETAQRNLKQFLEERPVQAMRDRSATGIGEGNAVVRKPAIVYRQYTGPACLTKQQRIDLGFIPDIRKAVQDVRVQNKRQDAVLSNHEDRLRKLEVHPRP